MSKGYTLAELLITIMLIIIVFIMYIPTIIKEVGGDIQTPSVQREDVDYDFTGGK